MSDEEAQYILGDYEIPAGTHILRAVVATGTVRVGDSVVCDGNLAGGKGVLLGKNVVIHGDVLSNGPIHVSSGTQIDGKVKSLDPKPAEESVAMRKEPRQAAQEILPVVVQSTVRTLFDLALDAHAHGLDREGDAGGWWSLKRDALEATVDGLRDMLSEGFRFGDHSSPWTADEIFEMLIPRVIAPLVPVTVVRKGEEYGVITIGRPPHLDPATAPGWAAAAASVIALLGGAVNPAFHFEIVGDKAVLGATMNPDKVPAVARLKRSTDPAPTAA
ncbi:MAG: hypothetical protein ACYDDF_13165 [Thermoplasmatota archaeon]